MKREDVPDYPVCLTAVVGILEEAVTQKDPKTGKPYGAMITDHAWDGNLKARFANFQTLRTKGFQKVADELILPLEKKEGKKMRELAIAAVHERFGTPPDAEQVYLAVCAGMEQYTHDSQKKGR